MLTDNDIRYIKALAYRSGMDYFVNPNNPRAPDWRVLTTENGQYNKNYHAVLYQRIPFEGRTLYATIARWRSYPNFASFERTIVVADIAIKGIDPRDIYQNLHPDFELKNLRAMPDSFFTGYRPPLIIIDDLISE